MWCSGLKEVFLPQAFFNFPRRSPTFQFGMKVGTPTFPPLRSGAMRRSYILFFQFTLFFRLSIDSSTTYLDLGEDIAGFRVEFGVDYRLFAEIFLIGGRKSVLNRHYYFIFGDAFFRFPIVARRLAELFKSIYLFSSDALVGAPILRRS